MADTTGLTIDDIKTARAIFDGATIAETFKTVKGSNANSKRVVVKNHFKAALLKLVSAIPSNFTVTLKGPDGKPFPDVETQGEEGNAVTSEAPEVIEFKAWVESVLLRQWDGCDNFYSAFPTYLLGVFRDGTLLHKAVQNESGQAEFYRMDVIDTKVLGDGRTRRGVAGYEFTYTVSDSTAYQTPGSAGSEIVERYTYGKIEFIGTVPEGQEQSRETDWPFIAVAKLNCEDQDETPMGMSVAQSMVSPFMEYTRAQTDRALSNVMSGNQNLVIINGGANSSPMVGPGVTIKLDQQTPGVTTDAKFIGGNDSLTPLENEAEDHRRDVYLFAHVVPDSKDEITTQASGSGKAQSILSGPGRQWFNTMFMPKLQAWLENLLYMAAVIEGKSWARGQICVGFGLGESPDKGQQLEEAQFIAETIGAPREALRTIGREEEAIDRIMQEASEHGAGAIKREALMSGLKNDALEETAGGGE